MNRCGGCRAGCRFWLGNCQPDKALTGQAQVPSAAARAVLDRMSGVGLVDDQAFARAWVESRQQRRYLSRTALRHELGRKGVAPEVINDATDQVDHDAEYAAASALAAKKLRSLCRVEPGVRRRRLAGMLARRGFGPGVVYRVLDDLAADLADGNDQADAAEPGDAESLAPSG